MTTKNKKPQVVILCEDLMHYHFARKYLQNIGFNRIIPNICPKGRCSGEQYVREHYAKEIKAYRSKVKYLNIALVVVIDADLKSIDQRIDSLNESEFMMKLKQNARLEKEKIAIFVPKRNIETWIHYLNDCEYNEEETYKGLYQRDCSPSLFAEKLVKKICPKGLSKNAPSSLHHACKELKSLKNSTA